MKRIGFVLLIVVLPLLAGAEPQSTASEISSLRIEVSALKATVMGMQIQIRELQTKFADLDKKTKKPVEMIECPPDFQKAGLCTQKLP